MPETVIVLGVWISSALMGSAQSPKPIKLQTNQIVHLRCEGEKGEHYWLKGNNDEAAVGLATKTEGVPGTRWRVIVKNGVTFLICLDDPKSPRFLNGQTREGGVVLAKAATRETTGTQWAVIPVKGSVVQLKCLGI